MAFRIKKRQPAPDSSAIEEGDIQDLTENNEQTNTDPVQALPEVLDDSEIQSAMQSSQNNVVATQAWVWKVLKMFWNWRRFFATLGLRVAGGIHANRVKSCEIQGNDIYTQRLYLLDPEGRPGLLYIDGDGQLQIDYEFRDVYLHPGDDNIVIGRYQYTGKERLIEEFTGRTPAEILASFIPFASDQTRKLDGKVCFKLCPADNKEELVQHTLLFSSNALRNIIGFQILDENGNQIGETITLPEGTWKRVTINMPSFKYTEDGEEKTGRVQIAGKDIDWDSSTDPFNPPFFAPPPPILCPLAPVPHPHPPIPKLDTSIFDDEPVDDDIFDEDTTPTVDDVEVVYEDYAQSNYCNIILYRNQFQANKVQFLKVITEEA